MNVKLKFGRLYIANCDARRTSNYSMKLMESFHQSYLTVTTLHRARCVMGLLQGLGQELLSRVYIVSVKLGALDAAGSDRIKYHSGLAAVLNSDADGQNGPSEEYKHGKPLSCNSRDNTHSSPKTTVWLGRGTACACCVISSQSGFC